MMTKTNCVLGSLLLLCLTGCQATKLASLKPEVWKGNESKVSITRGAYQSTFDTAEVASKHYAIYGKIATLVEEANIWVLPNTDKYACEKPV
jgi:hypothetical protein